MQLIPLKRPLITSERLNEKLVQSENISCNSPISTSPITPTSPPTTLALQSPAACSVDHQINALPVINSNDDNEIEPAVSHTLDCQHHERHQQEQQQQQQTQENQTKLKKKDIKRIKRLEKKQQKQQQKQLKKNKNKKQQQQQQQQSNQTNNNDGANDDNEIKNGKKTNNNRPSNLKKQSSSTSSEVEKRIKTKTRGVTIVTTTFTNNATNKNNNTKPLANVKFAFESNVDNNNEVVSVMANENAAATNATSQNNKNLNGANIEIDANGNYDELPLIKVEADVVDGSNYHHDLNEILTNVAENEGGHNLDNLKVESSGFSRSSSESIPFIDDSPRHCQYNLVNGFPDGGRFIVLQPQNIGSQSIIYARKIEKQAALSSVKPLLKRDQFDKSAQILYQSLKESIDHHFERVEQLESKLCQVCHEFLIAPDTVKCLTCGLVCHHSCTASQVSI